MLSLFNPHNIETTPPYFVIDLTRVPPTGLPHRTNKHIGTYPYSHGSQDWTVQGDRICSHIVHAPGAAVEGVGVLWSRKDHQNCYSRVPYERLHTIQRFCLLAVNPSEHRHAAISLPGNNKLPAGKAGFQIGLRFLPELPLPFPKAPERHPLPPEKSV